MRDIETSNLSEKNFGAADLAITPSLRGNVVSPKYQWMLWFTLNPFTCPAPKER